MTQQEASNLSWVVTFYITNRSISFGWNSLQVEIFGAIVVSQSGSFVIKADYVFKDS